MFELSNYLPDSFVPVYDEFKETLASWLAKMRIIRSSPVDCASAESTRARKVFQEAENEQNRLKAEKEQKEADILDIFDVGVFGREGEWKKLDGKCLEKEAGE